MRTYKVRYTVSYDCTVLVPEETDEDENLYSEDYLLEDLISDIDIPEGGVNDSRYVRIKKIKKVLTFSHQKRIIVIERDSL